MRLFFSALVSAALLAGCTTSTGTQPTSTGKQTKVEKPTVQRSRKQALSMYSRVTRRVQPVAQRICRSKHPSAPKRFCAFKVDFIDNPKQPPNAFQTVGKDGRPIVAFNINMLLTVKNQDEVAFILGHEFGHQIARHIGQTRNNATLGGLLGGVLVAAAGGNPNIGIDLGSQIGARAYSKDYELQADTIGTHIAYRAGFNPRVGAQSFNRTGGSDAFLSTHPPGGRRIATVQNTMAQIDVARKQGRNAPVTW